MIKGAYGDYDSPEFESTTEVVPLIQLKNQAISDNSVSKNRSPQRGITIVQYTN